MSTRDYLNIVRPVIAQMGSLGSKEIGKIAQHVNGKGRNEDESLRSYDKEQVNILFYIFGLSFVFSTSKNLNIASCAIWM